MNVKTVKATLRCLSVVIVWMGSAILSDAVIDPDTLAGLWQLDDGQGKTVKDDSANKNNGKLIGEPKWINGSFGKALEFDGTDQMIDTPYISDDQNPAFTIMAWIRPSEAINKQIVVAGRSNGGPQLNLNSSGKAMTGFKMSNGQFAHVTGTTTFDKGKWTHIAGTFDGKVINVYINGVEEGELKPAAPAGANQFGFQIGAFNESFHGGGYIGQFAPAALDDVAVFNAALTTDDLTRIVNKGLAGALNASPSGKIAVTWGAIKQSR
ncbi:MAG: LamG domain-containing protein [Candidatus Poribacteria bacterium]|nr:LamG domain-containing protein [Candidatus Poribacteria bacterium]